jgi:Tol biopolymer transport system component
MRKQWFRTGFVLIVLLASLAQADCSPVAASGPPATARVSENSRGEAGNGDSYRASVSLDGRYVAFYSAADNLVSVDTNHDWDVFVHDAQTMRVTRVSISSDGAQGDGFSGFPSISQDGRYVAFSSSANNLVPDDTNGFQDIFVHDRLTGRTVRASTASDGTQGNEGSFLASLSGNGRYVAFVSLANNLVQGDTNGLQDVFVHDCQTGRTTRISVTSQGGQAAGPSDTPAMSANGRYAAFRSLARNLVPNDTNGVQDIFVHDLETGRTTRVSVASDGTQANGPSGFHAISADGRYVAFESLAGNLTAGDTNGCWDIFVHDCQTGHTTRASVA